MYASRKIGEIAKVKGGKRVPKGYKLSEIKTQHPYIRARDIRGGRIDTLDLVFITNETYSKIHQYTVRENDVCITIAGNIGDVGIIPSGLDGANLTENAVKLIDLENCNHQYLKYSLLSSNLQEQMKLHAAGAAQPKLGIYKVQALEIPFPPLPTQRKIAAILSAYDDLIENNTRRIQILEEIAQTIYREWFIRFRFPGYETIRMIDSGTEFGEVPEGWEVSKLGDVIELAYGKGLKKDDRTGGNIPVYGSSGVVGYHNEALVKSPGIIVGRKGNVGSVFWSNTDFYPIDTTYFVRTELSLHYVFYNLQHQNFINNDAAVPGLSRNQAILLPIVVPSQEVMGRFEYINSLLFLQIRNLQQKNTNLRATRDLLLQKLVSGEVDVSELEIDVVVN